MVEALHERVRAVGRDGQVGKAHPGAAHVDQVHAVLEVGDGVVAARAAVDEGVRAGAAGERVVARTAAQDVVAGAAVEGVVAGAALQGIVAAEAADGVVAAEPVDGVVVRGTGNGVRARRGVPLRRMGHLDAEGARGEVAGGVADARTRVVERHRVPGGDGLRQRKRQGRVVDRHLGDRDRGAGDPRGELRRCRVRGGVQGVGEQERQGVVPDFLGKQFQRGCLGSGVRHRVPGQRGESIAGQVRERCGVRRVRERGRRSRRRGRAQGQGHHGAVCRRRDHAAGARHGELRRVDDAVRERLAEGQPGDGAIDLRRRQDGRRGVRAGCGRPDTEKDGARRAPGSVAAPAPHVDRVPAVGEVRGIERRGEVGRSVARHRMRRGAAAPGRDADGVLGGIELRGGAAGRGRVGIDVARQEVAQAGGQGYRRARRHAVGPLGRLTEREASRGDVRPRRQRPGRAGDARRVVEAVDVVRRDGAFVRAATLVQAGAQPGRHGHEAQAVVGELVRRSRAGVRRLLGVARRHAELADEVEHPLAVAEVGGRGHVVLAVVVHVQEDARRAVRHRAVGSARHGAEDALHVVRRGAGLGFRPGGRASIRVRAGAAARARSTPVRGVVAVDVHTRAPPVPGRGVVVRVGVLAPGRVGALREFAGIRVALQQQMHFVTVEQPGGVGVAAVVRHEALPEARHRGGGGVVPGVDGPLDKELGLGAADGAVGEHEDMNVVPAGEADGVPAAHADFVAAAAAGLEPAIADVVPAREIRKLPGDGLAERVGALHRVVARVAGNRHGNGGGGAGPGGVRVRQDGVQFAALVGPRGVRPEHAGHLHHAPPLFLGQRHEQPAFARVARQGIEFLLDPRVGGAGGLHGNADGRCVSGRFGAGGIERRGQQRGQRQRAEHGGYRGFSAPGSFRPIPRDGHCRMGRRHTARELTHEQLAFAENVFGRGWKGGRSRPTDPRGLWPLAARWCTRGLRRGGCRRCRQHRKARRAAHLQRTPDGPANRKDQLLLSALALMGPP